VNTGIPILGSGWFPRLDRLGRVCSGRGTVYADGVPVAAGYNPQWLADGEVLAYQGADHDWFMSRAIAGLPPEVVLVAAPTYVYAAGTGRHHAAIVRPDGGREIECTYDPVTGVLATVVEYGGSNDRRSIYYGEELLVAGAPVWSVRAHGGFVAWRHASLNTQGWFEGTYIPLRVMEQDWEGSPVPMNGGDRGLWLMFQTNLDLRVRPVDSSFGYIVETGGEDTNHNPDAVMLPGGPIRLAWNDKDGGGWWRDLDLSAPRVDVSTPLPKPPEPPKPVPPGPLSEPRPHDGSLYDLLAFIIGDPDTWPRVGPTHPMHQALGPQPGLFHYVKFGTSLPAPYVPGEAYETWAHDEHWIYHLEDASSEPYHFSDPRWFPRRMAIGEDRGFDTGWHEIVSTYRVGCAQRRRDHLLRRQWVHAVYDRYYWGEDLGERATAVIVYDPAASQVIDGVRVGVPGRNIELGYYALGAGSVRWESYPSTKVYTDGVARFNEADIEMRSDFYLVGGPALLPKLTGCVPQVCPHLPPWDPNPQPPNPEPEPPMEEIGAIKGPGNKFGRVLAADFGMGPFGWYPIRFDRDTPDDDCWFKLTRPDARHQLQHTKIDGILGGDATEHSADIPRQFYLKPGSERGALESPLVIYDIDSPLMPAYFAWPENGVVGPAFAWVPR